MDAHDGGSNLPGEVDGGGRRPGGEASPPGATVGGGNLPEPAVPGEPAAPGEGAEEAEPAGPAEVAHPVGPAGSEAAGETGGTGGIGETGEAGEAGAWPEAPPRGGPSAAVPSAVVPSAAVPSARGAVGGRTSGTGAGGGQTESWGRVASLPLPYRVGAAVALAVVGVVTCVHLGMVFLHVAPSNTLTKQHGAAIEEWIYPEFEQNWKLFAPNPLQQNIAVEVRAQVRTPDGSTRITGWYSLSAQDGRAIDGNLLPSHTQQNELRRAWDFFTATHGDDNRPVGLRGTLSEQYLRRIVVLRLGRDDAAGSGGVLERVQIRSRTTNVEPPKWSAEKVPDTPTYRELGWWPVPASEANGGVR